MINTPRQLFLVILLLPLICSAGSQTDSASSEERPWQLGVSLGYGLRTNPLIDSDDLPIVAVIDFSWYGERWFFDNGDLGITLADNQTYTLNAVTRINSERLFFENPNSLLINFPTNASSGDGEPNPGLEPGEGVTDGATDSPGGDDDAPGPTSPTTSVNIDIPDRDPAVEAGFELLTDGRWGFFQATATHDISDRHKGYEIDLTLGKAMHFNRFTITTSGGISWRSDELNNYYYGLRPEESAAQSSSYIADSGINWHLRTLIRYYLSRQLSAGAVLEYQQLSDSVSGSPFVTDDQVTTAYVGVKYTF